MPRIFLDTGAFIARAIARDDHHVDATRTWAALRDHHVLLSSEHVFDETLTLIARRVGYPYAAEWGALHLQSGRIEWLKTRADDLKSALTLMRKFSDQGISFTDCVSFVLMRRERLKLAFSYDRHFRHAGFTLF